MTLALAVIASLLVAFDCAFTDHWMRKYGRDYEDNPLILWLAERMPQRPAILLAVCVPAAVFIGAFSLLHWNIPLAFYAGVRTFLAYKQIQSLRLEPLIDRTRAAASLAALTPSQPGR